MSSADTRALIAQAIEGFTDEVPALKNLKVVLRLELRARGHDVPVWRVEVPGPKIDRHAAGDARLDGSVSRSHFNELAAEGRIRHWREAFEHGDAKAEGSPEILKLIANVVERQEERSRTRKLRTR